jgi:hypothetical protein
MLQELGYEKQSKYYGTQVTYGGFEPVWHVQVYIFTLSPSEGFLRSRRSMQPSLQDAPFTLEFMMPTAKSTWSLIHAIANSRMEQSIPIPPPQRASGPTYIHVEPIPGSRNFKLKKQVELITALTKELDSATEEVECWQDKYEEAMKTIWKLKRHCPQDLETLFEEEAKEFTPASPPHKMATCALPVYVIPNNDDD